MIILTVVEFFPDIFDYGSEIMLSIVTAKEWFNKNDPLREQKSCMHIKIHRNHNVQEV